MSFILHRYNLLLFLQVIKSNGNAGFLCSDFHFQGFLGQDQAVFTAVLATSLTYDKAFMLQGVDKLRHGVLVLLHRVRNFLLRHGPLVP